MRQSAPKAMHWTRGLWTVLLMFVLALRTIADPVIPGANDPGVMTICAGGKVYYVTLDGEPAEMPDTEAEPCPYTGMTLAGPGVDGPDPSPDRMAHAVPLPLPDVPVIKARRARQNEPRAPPFLSKIS